MCLPAVMLQVGFSDSGLTAGLCRRIAVERSMKSAVVVIILECFKLPLQINCVAEQRVVKKFATNGPDQALDEWV